MVLLEPLVQSARGTPEGRLPDLELLRKQTVLAKFGELALRSDDLNEILTEACRLVGEGLGTDLAAVMKLTTDDETLLVHAGVGWLPGIVGAVSIKMGEHTSVGLAFRTGNPTVSPNITTETRFKYPEFLIDNGVQAMADVAIIGSEGRAPFGVLQIDSREPRQFTENDTAFFADLRKLNRGGSRPTARDRGVARGAGRFVQCKRWRGQGEPRQVTVSSEHEP